MQRLASLNACSGGLDWFQSHGCHPALLAEQHPEWYLWVVGKLGKFDPKRLDSCATAAPRTALEYAAKFLTPKRLDSCATAEPRTALEYAAKFLTPKRLDSCRAQR